MQGLPVLGKPRPTAGSAPNSPLGKEIAGRPGGGGGAAVSFSFEEARAEEMTEDQAAAVLQEAASAYSASLRAEPLPVDDVASADESSSAARVQAQYRGRAARKQQRERREEEGAATRVQAITRGRNSRRNLQQEQPSVAEGGAGTDGGERNMAFPMSVRLPGGGALAFDLRFNLGGGGGDVAAEGGSAEEAAAATRVQAISRGAKERKQRREETEAATRVQAISRGHRARKAAGGGGGEDGIGLRIDVSSDNGECTIRIEPR